jgi:hypothetical protein
MAGQCLPEFCRRSPLNPVQGIEPRRDIRRHGHEVRRSALHAVAHLGVVPRDTLPGLIRQRVAAQLDIAVSQERPWMGKDRFGDIGDQIVPQVQAGQLVLLLD